ncbi:MAG: 2-succinyl-5-enolpyruvyl-6-hydroxy-3-cyclohexene-1-carboxylic-acid synthase [Nocardioidaceae bacterium]|nr:2-succinyl-5-enolpyruvyl-6-hydroxy-3-cyclohexene-1-carboxylic-acid synthase [Nocardioidaceae bacterium]
MNTSTLTARTVVDELARGGVRDAVLAPGSRSAPLAMALLDAETSGRIRLHVRIDERSAGFLALGLAKVSGRPVPVVTTSGTAVANLHPAVLEAHHAGVPLVVLTADRPARFRGTGANQTTDQVKIFGTAVRLFADCERADRALVGRALAAATGRRSGAPGPAHLNLPLDEPLLPDDGTGPEVWPPGRDSGAPWTDVAAMPPPAPVRLEPGPRTVVVAGDSAGPPARVLAERGGWPLLAEPSSGSRTGSAALGAYRLLLESPALGGRIERVIVYGHATLSRQVNGLLSRDDVEIVVVNSAGPWPDAGRQASRVVPAATVEQTDHEDWLPLWRDADSRAQRAIATCLDAEPQLTPYEVARAMSQAVPPRGLLVVGSSHPIRDLDLMAVAPAIGQRRKVIANRGLSGIDGMVSTAIGAALGRDSSRSLAYLGDLTFLHDSNGVLIGPDEPRPDLTIVVANDDGGSLFSVLEQGGKRFATSFERVFGTPTRADLGALCAAAGLPHTRIDGLQPLREALARPPTGIEVIEVRIDRTDRRGLDSRIREAVAPVVAGQHMRSSD